MRRITKRHSTKTERIVYEILKELKIPFKHRWMVKGREVDFIIGDVAIEINGHEQDEEKNKLLIREGYRPLHIHNQDINKNKTKQIIYDYYKSKPWKNNS